MQSVSKTEPAFGWWDMVRAFYFLLDKKRKSYFLYTAILILVLFYDLIPTYIIAKIVDFFAQYEKGDSLKVFYLYVVFFACLHGIVSLVRLTIKKRLMIIQSEVTYFTRVKGFEKLMEFSLLWHDKENTGNKVQKIQSGTQSLREIQALLSNEVFGQITSIVGVIIAFIFISPKFAVLSGVYLSIFIAIQLSFYKRMVEMNNENNILMEKAGGAYYEGLGNILTLKTLGVKDDFKKNIVSKEALTKDHTIKRTTLMNNKWKSFQIVNAVTIAAILLLVGTTYLAGAITIGSIFIIYNYYQKLAGSVSQSTDSVEKLINAKSTIARMMQIFWDTTLITKGKFSFPNSWDKIKISDASFIYPQKSTNSDIKDSHIKGIKNINLEINKHEKIGVVGKSGGGKSTFAKILLGLYELTGGSFSVDNINFYDIKHEEVTKEIALVLQDSEMFNLSLRENITLMREYKEELFERAISISQLKEVIEKLPEGLDTLIGEKGYRLSGGERQRIGIARAIYKDPQILVLDEATSSLDSKTEEMIQRALEENLKKKTVISIAHRISTLKNVDKIIVFENGNIVEEGKFDDLSRDSSSKFFNIYKHQEENFTVI